MTELEPKKPQEEVPINFGESRLRGAIIIEKNVRTQLEYLRNLEEKRSLAGSFEALLSGESQFSDLPEGQGEIKSKAVLAELGLNDPRYLTFGGALRGPAYGDLKNNHPDERYKFYSSFDLTSPAKVASATEWFTEVAQMANEKGLSLTTKSFDHSYDSLNLYTWNPAELAEIIKELYPKYVSKGIYSETPHFFQGAIDGISPDHVGFVQEPINGWPPGSGRSHSSRMAVLGEFMDERLDSGQSLTTRDFIEASSQAGVNPERPYLIAA